MPQAIRLAESDEDRKKVFCFRYAIYVEEMGRVQHYADHDARTIIEPFDETGRLFLAEENGEVVGTVRTNFGQDTDFGTYREFYGLDSVGRYAPQHISITTKFMVAPAYRGGTLGYRLATATYRLALEKGILFDFIDCNPHLEDTFLRLGYHRYRGRIQHPEYGDVLPLVLPLTDLDHLEAVGSPWVRICQEHFPHFEANRLLRLTVQNYHAAEQTLAA